MVRQAYTPKVVTEKKEKLWISSERKHASFSFPDCKSKSHFLLHTQSKKNPY